MRLPKNPEDKRAAAAARKKRWRDKKAAAELVDAHITASVGAGPTPAKPLPPISSKDLAQRIVDKYSTYLDGVEDEDLADREVVAALKLGLTAQGILDARAREKAKSGMQLELAAGLAAILSGMLPGTAPLQLEDGNVIEGEYDAVD